MKTNYKKEYTIQADSPAEIPTLEITTKVGCVVNCRYCPQKILKEQYTLRSLKRELTFDVYKTCINKLPTNAIVCFGGFCEPFLSKDIIKMILYANKAHKEISIFTTLVGMTIEKFEMIKNIPFRKVVIHLPDEKNFANIPITQEYLKLLNYILETRNEAGKLFVDKMTCQAKPNAVIWDIVKEKYHVSWNMTNRAGNLKYPELPTFANFEGPLRCRLSNFNHNVLLPNGDVVLCSFDFGLKHVLGNLLHEDYNQIMNSSMMNYIKSEALKRNPNILCCLCSEARIIQ